MVAADVREEAVDSRVRDGGSDRIYGVGVDIANRDQVAAFVSGAVERFGRLYGLVNCAGIRVLGTFWISSPRLAAGPVGQSRRHVLRLPGLRPCREGSGNSGAIVNICSAAGIRGVPNRLGYAASKYGIGASPRPWHWNSGRLVPASMPWRQG